MARLWEILDEVETEYYVPKEYVDEDGFINITSTLQAGIIANHIPKAKMKSKDKEIQERIDLYEENKNVAVFLTPTKKEFESGNW